MTPYAPYTIELLGKLCIRHADQTVSRFRTYKTGALLAYLAYHAPRFFTRDQLTVLFWPEDPPSGARQSLSQSLSSLRRQFEPPGTIPGTFLQATRFTVGINGASVRTDVADFEDALKEAERAAGPEDRIPPLLRAVRLYNGELLPGYYEEWVIQEQQRLAERYFFAVHALVPLLVQQGESERVLEVLQHAVGRDPYREETQLLLIRHLAAIGRGESARRQGAVYERLLREGMEETPGLAFRRTLEEIRKASASKPFDPDPRVAPPLSQISTRTNGPDSAESRAAPPPIGTPPPFEPTRRGNVPAPLNRFYGREREIALLKRLLQMETRRLVTLVGPGGSGKTRLGMEVARRVTDSYPGGVWFVPLADLEEIARFPEAVAAALNLQTPPGGSLNSALTEAFSRSPSLLLLDNFEHLREGAALIREWLEQVPHLTCLVTSRYALDLEGETVFPVSPLPVPEAGLSAPEVLNNPSVRLFLDRAQNVRPDFQATPKNTELLVELCRRLEGLPLAVELAAARVQVVSLSRILKQLDQRFDFLVSRKRDVPSRHRTLRATLEWSIQILSPECRTLLEWLSVFRGGWTQETAEAVCEVPGTLECLEVLSASFLIQSEERQETLRFRMLETIRELAEDRITTEERTALHHRHAECFLSLAEETAPLLSGPRQCEGLDRLEEELENLRSALRWYVSRGDGEPGRRLAVSLCPFWLERGYIGEGRQWFRELLSLPWATSQGQLTAQAQAGAGLLALWQGDYQESEALLHAALEGATGEGDTRNAAYTLAYLGISAFNQCDYEDAERRYNESLALFQKEDDPQGKALTHYRLGSLHAIRGSFRDAVRHCNLALNLYKEREDRIGASSALNTLGYIHMLMGHYRIALSHFNEALVLKRALRDKLGISIVMQNQAIALQQEGKNKEACRLFEESLRLRRDLGDKGGVVNILLSYGFAQTGLGDYAAARQSYLEALSLQRELGHRGGLEGYAGLLVREGDDVRATLFFAAEEANRQEMGTPLPPNETETHDEYLHLLQTRMGGKAFERAWEEGRNLGWERAADMALEGVKFSDLFP